MMRLLYMIFVFSIIGSQHAGGKMSKDVVVFWIPPEVETYVPVTPENIEEVAFKIVHIKNQKQADKIIDLIEKSDQSVDSKRIRAKIVTDDRFYNFDSKGTGISSTGQAVKIDLKNLKLVLCE